MSEQHVGVRGGVTNRLNTTRMNPSNLYEQYFAGISRRIKLLVSHEVDVLGGLDGLTNESVSKIFAIVLGGIKIFDTEQYHAYKKATCAEQMEIINEIYNRECYIYYKVSSNKRAYQVVHDVIGTIYEPVKSKFVVPTEDGDEVEWSNDEVMIAPQYIILLAKTPDNYLASSSAKTNHYKLPVSAGPRVRQNIPYRNSPVKFLSETETRLYAAYIGPKGLAEFKDRANSVATHELIYKAILDADKPTDIDCLVDRNVHPFGTDNTIELVDSILNVSGIKLTYVPEK